VITHSETANSFPQTALESGDRPPQLILFIHAITSGGAERVMTTLANAWAAKGWEVHLLTLDDGRCPPFYPLDHRVHHLPLAISRPLSNADGSNNTSGVQPPRIWKTFSKILTFGKVLYRARRIRQAFIRLRPDLVISFIDQVNVLALLALVGTDIPVIISERVDPSQYRPGLGWEWLRKLTYPRADLLVVQGERIRDFFRGRVRERARIIPTPVPLPPAPPAEAERSEAEPIVVAVGRLVPQKGFDLLLQAFARLAPRYPDWKLEIWGEGPERAQLEQQRQALGLEDRCSLPGNHPCIYEVHSRAGIFVLSSRFEGFPNALCEAMSMGLPVVSFDCPSGPAEIIRPDIDGLLVPAEDATELERALDRLMGDDSLRASLGSRALEVTQRFSLESVLARWESCIHEVLSDPR